VFTLPAFYISRQWTKLVDWKAAAVFCFFLLVQMLFKRLHPIFLIIAGAAIGLVLF
jgi:chromate transport protein